MTMFEAAILGVVAAVAWFSFYLGFRAGEKSGMTAAVAQINRLMSRETEDGGEA